MDIHLNTLYEKTTKKELKIIKITLLILLLLIFAFILKLFFFNPNSLQIKIITNLNDIFKNTKIVLSFLSAICCFSYYLSLKKHELYILTIFYTCIFIEVLVGNFLVSYNFPSKSNYFILVTAFRILILTLLFVNEKIINFINSKKIYFSISILLITISLIYIESNSLFMHTIKNNNNFIIIISLIFLFIILIIIALLSFKAIKECNAIYLPLIASLVFYSLCSLYLLLMMYNPDIYAIKDLSSYLSYLSLFSVISGMFVELTKRIHKSKLSEAKLKLFFDLCENDSNKSTLILDSNLNLLYANKQLFNDLNIKNSTDNYLEIYKFTKKYLLNNKIDFILNYLDINNKWKSTFLVDNDSLIYDVTMQKFKLNNSSFILVLSMENIIEQYIFTSELTRNENELKSITESIDDLIITLTGNIITYVNTAVIKELKYSKEELEGSSIFKILKPSEYTAYINKPFENLFYTHVLIDKLGNEIKVESNISSIKSNSSNSRFVIVSRNISKKKEFELMKLKYKQAKEYEVIKNEFFANISHELRTPINIIYSCLQLLDNNKENIDSFIDIYNKYDKNIKQNCLRMLRLVNNLIDITKIDVDFIKGDFFNLDIVRLIEDVCISIIPYVESRKLNITFDTDIEELIISCDPDKIERIILNLLSNSIKFTNINGNIFINISHDTNYVYISVKDDGIGIPSHTAPFIFDRFFQTDKSLRRTKEGSGIGLCIVKSLVEFHGGSIDLNSNINIGTEFIIKLPNKIIDEKYDLIPTSNFNPSINQISIEFSDIYEI